MPVQLLIWRLSSDLPIANPVHGVIYAATYGIKRPVCN